MIIIRIPSQVSSGYFIVKAHKLLILKALHRTATELFVSTVSLAAPDHAGNGVQRSPGSANANLHREILSEIPTWSTPFLGVLTDITLTTARGAIIVASIQEPFQLTRSSATRAFPSIFGFFRQPRSAIFHAIMSVEEFTESSGPQTQQKPNHNDNDRSEYPHNSIVLIRLLHVFN